MKRRKVLIGATVTTAAAVAGAYLWKTQSDSLSKDVDDAPTNEARLAQLLRDRLSMLMLPDATLEAFVQDHTHHEGEFKDKRLSSKVVQKFLLSTDFFPAANEAQELKYVAYHDPYLMPCRNPFRGT